jgi:hypothetical protein
MTSIDTLEMKLSMQEIVRLYQAVNDAIHDLNEDSIAITIKKDYETLSRKLTKFMYDYEQLEGENENEEEDVYEKEMFKLHISK